MLSDDVRYVLWNMTWSRVRRRVCKCRFDRARWRVAGRIWGPAWNRLRERSWYAE